MRDNINSVAQRGERLDVLQDKTDNLAQSAQGFRRGANRVRKQMWWKVRTNQIILETQQRLNQNHSLNCRHLYQI